MNTNKLSKKYTSQFFTQEEYDKLQSHWKWLVNSEYKDNLRAIHHMIYLVAMGKDWRKAFHASTKQVRLDNGYKPIVTHFSLSGKYFPTHYTAPFAGLITEEMLYRMFKFINKDFKFENGEIVSSAYDVPEEVV